MTAAAPAQAADADCVRSEPEPLVAVAKPGLSARQFRRTNAHEAVEDLAFARGDRLRIDHGGCEYFVLTFTVRPTQGVRSRLLTAARGLRQLAALKPAAPFDLPAAAAAMESLHRSGPPLVDGQDYPVPGDGEDFLQARFSFDAAPHGAVRFRLLKGPL